MTTFYRQQGTTLTWTSSGGDYVITLTSLANGGGRAGPECDFGSNWPDLVRVEVELDFNVAPTAANVVNVFWASSYDGTNYDGECSGSDEAYDDENVQKRLHLIGSLICTNDTDPQRQSWIFALPARYGLPVISNQSGQALTATGTDQKVKVTPLYITDGA